MIDVKVFDLVLSRKSSCSNDVSNAALLLLTLVELPGDFTAISTLNTCDELFDCKHLKIFAATKI